MNSNFYDILELENASKLKNYSEEKRNFSNAPIRTNTETRYKLYFSSRLILFSLQKVRVNFWQSNLVQSEAQVLFYGFFYSVQTGSIILVLQVLLLKAVIYILLLLLFLSCNTQLLTGVIHIVL